MDSRLVTKIALALALTGSLVVAAPATAQLPPNLPPILPPPDSGGPSESVGSADGEALAYGANPSRTGAAAEQAVFGPLQRAWRKNYSGSVHQALVVDGMAIVSANDRIIAYRASNGEELWSQPIASPSSLAPIAADGDRVFVADFDGTSALIRSFDAATGNQIWQVNVSEVGQPGAPVAADGSVFVAGDGAIIALAAIDGSILWERPLFTADQSRGLLAIDGARVFLASGCTVGAYLRSNGDRAWGGDGGCGAEPASVFAGRVYADREVYDAETGEREMDLELGARAAFGGNLGYEVRDDEVEAIDLATGARAWIRGARGPGPLLVGPTLYALQRNAIHGWAASSGELLSRARVPDSSVTDASFSGISAGAGLLFVAGGHDLTAYTPVLTPTSDGIAVASSGFDVDAGTRISIVGGVGPELRGSRPRVTLTANPKIGRTNRAVVRQTLEDGTAYFRGRVRSNTRHTVRTGDARDSFTAYAYPRGRITAARATSRTEALIESTFKDVIVRGLKGERLVAYYGPPNGGRNTRLGTGKLHAAGKGAVSAIVRFGIPRGLGRNDLFTVCIQDLPKLGYGRNVGFARDCGKRHVKLPRADGKLAADREDRRAAIRPRPLGFDLRD